MIRTPIFSFGNYEKATQFSQHTHIFALKENDVCKIVIFEHEETIPKSKIKFAYEERSWKIGDCGPNWGIKMPRRTF